MTLTIRAEQAIEMNKGRGRRRGKQGGRGGEDCRIHADVSRKGKEEVALRECRGEMNKGTKEGREDGG